MASGEVLRARVDSRLSKKVHKWAREHQVNVSEAVRVALRHLVEQQERKKRAEKALQDFDAAAEKGLFDPPEGATKAGGFR